MKLWGNTQEALQRLKQQGKIVRVNGIHYYEGRHVIGRDTPIDGGVSIGNSEREAIVVDSNAYPLIRDLYYVARRKAMVKGVISRELVLEAVYDTVFEAMPPTDMSEEMTSKLINTYLASNDIKMSLDRFIENRVGVCRHHALACGVLLELFKKDRHIFGKPSADRNIAIFQGSHAWCRYTGSSGDVIILDVSQNYFGSIERALREGRWDYRRPKDKTKP